MPRVTCPNCSASCEVADDLAADTRVRCDQCGKRFSPSAAPAEDAPLELDDLAQESGGRRSRVIFVASGLVFLLAGGAVGWFVLRPAKRDEPPVAVAPPADPPPTKMKEPDPPRVPKQPEPRVSSVQYTAADLLDRYRRGPGYDGVIFTVTGTVVHPPGRHANGEVVVQLAGSGSGGPVVWCCMDPKLDTVAARLPARAEVVVRGKCVGAGAARGAGGLPPAAPNEVVLADCTLVGDPDLPVPSGVDHPEGIEHHGIAVRVTGVYVGRPVIVLGPNGPNPGATARTRDKYLVVKMEVKNKRQEMYSFAPPAGGGEAWIHDEWRTPFDYGRFEVPVAPGTVVANELAATPTRRWRFEGETTAGPLAERQTGTYYLIFECKHLGEGKKLYLTLPPAVFGLREVDQVIRFDRSVVESLPESASPDLTPATALAIELAAVTATAAGKAAVEAQVAEVVAQLSKGKTPADRMKAADELLKMGTKAKTATGPLCRALFDPSTQVRVAALDALKQVNPDVYAPVAALVSPLSEADLLFMGSSGRPEAVTALAQLGAEGRAAVPVLVWYKTQISQPGGWPQVPAVVDTLAALAPDDPAVAALLVQGLSKDGFAAARLSAAKGLAKTKASKESVAALAAAVRGDPVAEVRLVAVNALGAFGADAKAALKAIEAAKMDPDQRVREAARAAIEKVK